METTLNKDLNMQQKIGSGLAKEWIVMKYAVFFIGLVVSNIALAQNEGVFAGFHLGQASVELDQNIVGEHETVGMASYGISAGYLSRRNFLVQLDESRAENSNLVGVLDGYSLTHFEFSTGYQLQWKQLSLTPIIGVDSWKLVAEEGQLFHPGSEIITRNSGSDFLWGASLGYSFGRFIDAMASYKRSNTEFGSYRLLHLELIMTF